MQKKQEEAKVKAQKEAQAKLEEAKLKATEAGTQKRQEPKVAQEGKAVNPESHTTKDTSSRSTWLTNFFNLHITHPKLHPIKL